MLRPFAVSLVVAAVVVSSAALAQTPPAAPAQATAQNRPGS
jgi:hypothetical protein